ncbi:MAG: TIR domain-containing protein [Verrucomicrobia bacterium]|nr:TIR domain-containing protein [Leptolyngbya sp. ES-bin-22]
MSTAPNNTAIELFFSYSHRDETLRDELAKHLSILKRQGVITAWHDRQITAGSEWAGAIDDHLDSARVILLLISADFLASDYCWDVELKRAIERHEAGEACVIPIILKPVDWSGAPFSKLQALPKNAQPVTSWANPDEAFLDVAKGIRRAVEAIVQAKPTTSVADASPVVTAPAFAPSSPVSTDGLTSRQRRRLEDDLASQQQEYDLLSRKLKNLRQARAIETDVAVKLKLEVQIDEATADLETVEQRLNQLESQLR